HRLALGHKAGPATRFLVVLHVSPSLGQAPLERNSDPNCPHFSRRHVDDASLALLGFSIVRGLDWRHIGYFGDSSSNRCSQSPCLNDVTTTRPSSAHSIFSTFLGHQTSKPYGRFSAKPARTIAA